MRKKQLLILLLLCGFFGGLLHAQTSGGPDAYGYAWVNSNASGGPAFNWIDTTGRNFTRVNGLTDDNSVGPVNLGFDFHYYWSDFNQVKIGSNGWLGFNNIGNIAACIPQIPTAGGAGDNFLAPYMSDLNFRSSYPAFPNPGELWWWTNGSDTAVFTWYNVPWWKDDAGGAAAPDWEGSNTFQVIISASDSSITYQYLDVDQALFSPSGFCATDLEIGIENLTGNIGLSVYTGTTVPDDSLAIKIDYPQNTGGFLVPDATPKWNANSDNAGQFFLVGSNVDMLTSIENVGNTAITTPITINGKLKKLDLTTIVWQDNSSIPSLASGANSVVTFPTQAALTQAGQLYYEVSVSNGSDINPSNNLNTVEVSAVENVGGVIGLTYCTLNPPDGVIAWGPNTGDYGGGIYINPPVSPTFVKSVDVFIAGDGDLNTPMTSGFKIQIFEAGPSGPGALLDSVVVDANNVIENDWNNVPFPNFPAVSSPNGFYVSWIQGGDGIGLGTEAFGPISRRTFEVLDGQWARYRESSTVDFLLTVNVDGVVSVDPQAGKSITHLEIFPNPTSGMVNFAYEIGTTSRVDFRMTDMLGRIVHSADQGLLTAGGYQYSLNTAQMDAGVYFVTLQSGNQRISRKLVVTH